MKRLALLILLALPALAQYIPPGGGGGGTGCTVGNISTLVKGNGTGGCADSGITPANVIQSTGSYMDPAWIASLAASKLNSGALANGMTATTQSQADNSTKLATTAYVDTGLGGKLGTGAGAVGTTNIAATAVTSAKMAVVNTRRVCDIAVGDTSASALTNAQLGPQKRICYIPAASTIVEMDVAADAGTPNVIVGNNAAGSVSNIVSGALATAASGGIACSNTGGTTGIDGATTCTNTLQNTSLGAGSYLELVSGTAGGTAKLMTIHVIYTIN